MLYNIFIFILCRFASVCYINTKNVAGISYKKFKQKCNQHLSTCTNAAFQPIYKVQMVKFYVIDIFITV